MYLLKHEFSISLNYSKEGKFVHSEILDSVEKIQYFQPEFYFGTKKVEVKTETEEYYILNEINEEDEDDISEVYISKIFNTDEIMLNFAVYPKFILRDISCILYTLDNPEDIEKGRLEVYKYFEHMLVIKGAINANLLTTLKQLFDEPHRY